MKPESIVIQYIESAKQRIDFLTQALQDPLFSTNRKLTTGW